ncbi:hypothetical protein ACLKOZ_19715 [Arthrobacter sp. R4]|uniref:hypothetical protein n=1 Tax=Arthrobacter sp. R4 TaxID=644417 RepID=UPI003ED8F497
MAADTRQSSQELSDIIRGLWVDAFSFRASSDIYIQDTIPARAGADLFKNVWKLLRSAATTSRTPKAHISGNWSKVGDEAINDARFAHTKRGSYILPLLVPLPRPLDEEASTFKLTTQGNSVYHESDARRATRTMVQALTAVNAALIQPEKEPAPSVVADLVQVGVSRELITAINDIIKHSSVANLDLKVDWAGRLPGPSQAPESLVIPSEAGYRLEKALPLFKNSRRSTTETLTGPIYKMADRASDNFGIATMEVPRNGRISQVEVFINRQMMISAHDWFKEHRSVIVQGRVEVSPQGLVMRSPARFELLSDTMMFSGETT